jgi:hypothetical protein
VSRQHRTYKQIKQEFSPEMRAEISAGADQIRTELKIISTKKVIVIQESATIQESVQTTSILDLPPHKS